MQTAKRFFVVAIVSALLPVSAALADTKGPNSTEAPSLKDQVVGGSPVPAGKWHDTAGIVFGNRVQCTGVLVAPDVVLTAGHCIGGITAVILGTNNYSSGDAEKINVKQEIAYPGWRGTYDMGVLILERESTIKPRPIVPECMVSDYVRNGADVAIVGYGALDERGTQYGDVLMEAVSTITDFDCTTSVGCKSEAQPAGELGAGGGGIDSCYGDSGGPLYLLTDRGDFLIGLTSRGYDNNTIDCSQGGIYVRPDKVRAWIETATGRTLPIEGCNKAPLSGTLALTVEAGRTVSQLITIRDEDNDDSHTLSIQTPPQFGEITIDGEGRAHYTANGDHAGPDSFVVAITDNGIPNMTGTISVDVMVTEPPSGCQAGGNGSGLGGLLMIGLLAVGLRRRWGYTVANDRPDVA